MSPDLYPQMLFNHVPQTPTTSSFSLVYYLQLLSLHPITNKVLTSKNIEISKRNFTDSNRAHRHTVFANQPMRLAYTKTAK